MGNSHKNRFIKNGLDINLLSEENKLIISEIPKRDYTYVCKMCKKIPKIEVEFCIELGYIKRLYFIECRKSFGINIKSFDDDFNLMRVPLNELKKNQMKFKKEKEKNENILPFESIDDFNEYIKVYQSYLKIKERLKIYNSGDTNNNKIFSLFEDLLFIGLHGSGTRYEYENAIIIKEYMFTKFNIYSQEILLKNKQRLIKLKTFSSTNIEIFKIKKDLYALKQKEYSSAVIVKLEKLLDKDFVPNEYTKYCNYNEYKEYKYIPIELHKNIIIIKNDEKLKDISSLGKNRYLLQIETNYAYNNIYQCFYKEDINEYYFERVNLPHIGIKKILSLKNNNLVLFTEDDLYIYAYNYETNDFKILKEYPKIKNSKDYDSYEQKSFNIYESKNGDFVFNNKFEIVCISHCNYEIKCIINFDKKIQSFSQLNDQIFKITYGQKTWLENYYYLNIKKMRLYKKIKNYDRKYLCNNIYIEFSNEEILINEQKKNILRINYDFGIKHNLIINENKNIFGIVLEHRIGEKFLDFRKEEKMIFYQLK